MLRLISRFTSATLPTNIALGELLPSNGDVITIGRDVTDLGDAGVHMDFVLTRDILSRKHARVENISGSYVITDKSSTNGTFINGQLLLKNTCCILKPGMRITFGGTDRVSINDAVHENPFSYIFTDGAASRTEGVNGASADAAAGAAQAPQLPEAPLGRPDEPPVAEQQSTQPADSPEAEVVAQLANSNAPILSQVRLPQGVSWADVRALPPLPFKPSCVYQDGDSRQNPRPVDENIKTLVENSTCAICFELAVQPRAMKNCTHFFCAPCIDSWIETKQKSGMPAETVGCPSCRTVPACPVPVAAWNTVINALVVPTLDHQSAKARLQREIEWHELEDVRRRVAEAARQNLLKRRRNWHDDAAPHITPDVVAMRSARVPIVARYSFGRPGFRHARRTTNTVTGFSAEEGVVNGNGGSNTSPAAPLAPSTSEPGATAAVPRVERRRNVCSGCTHTIEFGDVELVDEDSIYHLACAPWSLFGRRITNAGGIGGLRDHDLQDIRDSRRFIIS
jgi:pSer/pThr/pTyr-binding forkhead associated (FHA) protein